MELLNKAFSDIQHAQLAKMRSSVSEKVQNNKWLNLLNKNKPHPMNQVTKVISHRIDNNGMEFNYFLLHTYSILNLKLNKGSNDMQPAYFTQANIQESIKGKLLRTPSRALEKRNSAPFNPFRQSSNQ
jgi:hypothetical protein